MYHQTKKTFSEANRVMYTVYLGVKHVQLKIGFLSY